jgi:hypothetical protein
MASTADVATLRHSEEMRIRYKIKVGWGGRGFITATPLLLQPKLHLRELSICIQNYLKMLSKDIVYITLCNFKDFL